MGSEWGLRPPTIELTTEDVTAILTAWPRAGFRGRRLSFHRQPARAPKGARGKAGDGP